MMVIWRLAQTQLAIVALMGSVSCSPALVDRSAEREKDWRLEFALMSGHERLPSDLAWLTLTNDSLEDKLACLETHAWAVGGSSHSSGDPGTLGACEELDRYRLIKSHTSVTIPLRIRLEQLPADQAEFEFQFLFPELPWPPLLGEPEWRSPRWKGTVQGARKSGETLLVPRK